MWRKFEDTIENKSTTLEKHVTPVPTIVFDDVMGFSFNPQIEAYHSKSRNPPKLVDQMVQKKRPSMPHTS